MQQLLPLLCMLACPVGMAIMWWMGRDIKNQTQAQAEDKNSILNLPTSNVNPAERVVLLKARLAQMQAEQTNIAEKIERIASENVVQPEKPVELTRQESVQAGRPG